MVIASFFIFCIYSGGLSNFLLIEGNWFYIKEPARVLNTEPQWIRYFLVVVCLACVSMWTGFHSQFGNAIDSALNRNGVYSYKRIYDAELDMRKVVVTVVFVIAFKFYLFSIGLHGRIVSKEYFEAGVGYKLGSQIRFIGDFLTPLLLICGYYYIVRRRVQYRIIFILAFVAEVFFSFLYGARGPILLPFLMLFVLTTLSNNRVNFSLVFVFVAVLFVSFTFVNDFKQFSMLKATVKARPTDPFKMLSQFQETNINRKMGRGYAEVVHETFTNSTNFLPEGAMALRHKEKIGLKETDVDFVGEALMIPWNAFVPRFLQENKTAPAWGYWFKNTVMKYQRKLKWSMAQTTVGNLYLTGGVLMVLFGFFLNGAVLKLGYLVMTRGILGLFFSLGILYIFCFEEIFSNQYIGLLRLIFVFPFLVLFLKK